MSQIKMINIDYDMNASFKAYFRKISLNKFEQPQDSSKKIFLEK